MPSSSGLDSLITCDLLREMARDATYARGYAYAQEGRVQEVSVQDGVLSARVEGREPYRVRLFRQGDRLEFDCTCPVGNELRFCKHCVAAGLAWLMAQGTALGAEAAGAAPREDSLARIGAFLNGLDAPALRELLLAEARVDGDLRERLLLREAAQDADPAAAGRLRAAIDRATATDGFVDYDDTYAFAGRVADVVDGLAALADVNPAAVVELAEHAIRRVEEALNDVDDSGGAVGDVLGGLLELHFQVCMEARPDPVDLAGRLFEAELESSYDSFSGAAERYAEVLGDPGLAEYRRLAQPLWDGLPPLGPGERDPDGRRDRFAITQMMEAIARADGDLAEQVAVLSRNLSSAYAFLQIAELYREAGDHEAAMEWARRGLDAFPGNPDHRLELFLADEHHRRDEHAQAVELVWAGFARGPSLERYQLLHEHAGRARTWPAWRERALSALREEAEGLRERQRVFGGDRMNAHSALVRVFLWEEDVEGAWREAAEGGCSDELWLRLAQAREAAHPADALQVYLRQVDAILVSTGERAYAEAVRLLPRVREIMQRVGEDFGRYVAGLREAHKRRRKLVEMLDRFERRSAAA
jgi:uncharacterized Zn finger protein